MALFPAPSPFLGGGVLEERLYTLTEGCPGGGILPTEGNLMFLSAGDCGAPACVLGQEVGLLPQGGIPK